MRFRDRDHAAQLLANKLARYKGKNPLILAIPRGAVPMGRVIADKLHGELDVVLVHKLGHPDNPEYAIAAVDEEGRVYKDSAHGEIGENYFTNAKNSILARLKQQRALYTPVRSRISPKGRIVIVVDDGIATGWTIKAAIRSLKEQAPQKIIAATAVGASMSLDEIGTMVDEVVCLFRPSIFFAVGEFYDDFPQVTDQEVIAQLKARAS